VFSTELGYTLEAAFREASSRRHAFFGLEHLLFALLFDDKIMKIVDRCGGNVHELRENIESFFSNESELLSDDESEPVQTPAVQRVLQRAVLHVRSAQKSVVTSVEVLVALMAEDDSHAVHFLLNQEITRLDILNFLAHGLSKDSNTGSDDKTARIDEEGDGTTQEDGVKTARQGALKKYTEELTEQARRGELDPVVGRDEEVERALRVLARRTKNNPLFIGDPGVGKTALAHALAQRIVAEDVPHVLDGARMFSLTIGNLVAGTKFRGEFEERLRLIVKELTAIEKAILFIDEIHTVVGAGATGAGSLDAANLLKPVLSSGKIRCVGSTTHEDFKKSFEKDRALSRRFSSIEVREPTVEETIKILQGLRQRFEDHHQVTFSRGALTAAAQLTARYVRERFLPDKAIDALDEAGAANMLRPVSRRKKTLTEKDIETVVSMIARVPIKTVSKEDTTVLQKLEQNLRSRVFGQEQAVCAIARSIKRSRANLQSENKPVGSFLFAGPTGVGKTELAKVLAGELGVYFHRFDMSEYMEKHTVARLVGAPPGYVGYEEGGILTDMVRKHPHAVLLFDEIEKAHHDIYNILLQVMDDAALTDSHGRKADFRHVIVILTTNLGSERAGSLGFGLGAATSHRDKAIKDFFKPEFRNRLDEVIHFEPLPLEIVCNIVDKFMLEIRNSLQERNVTIELSSEARLFLAKKGFDPILGARPMGRVLQRDIKDRLADELLFGELRKGGVVSVDMSDGNLSFTFRSH
jgi:ATP-dependent Clp protease ATP-binding subunit ClpA